MFQGENALKHRMLRLEPTDCSGKAARFNPLAEVRMGSLHAIAGITTAEKQKAAQQLYEGKYISSPRTDCRFLPEEQFSEAGAILAALRTCMPACANADATIKSKAWNIAKVTAHHAIIPTGVVPQTPLEENQANIYSLVCLGYARQYFPPLRYEAQHIIVELPSESGAKTPVRIWKAAGQRILDAGWTVLENDMEG